MKIIAKPYTIEQAMKVLSDGEIRMGLTYALVFRFRQENRINGRTDIVMPQCKELSDEQIKLIEKLFPE